MRITASSRNLGRMRESILENTEAPVHIHVPIHGQGHLLVEGVGVGPHRDGGLGLDPDLGDPGGDPASGQDVVRPRWRGYAPHGV